MRYAYFVCNMIGEGGDGFIQRCEVCTIVSGLQSCTHRIMLSHMRLVSNLVMDCLSMVCLLWIRFRCARVFLYTSINWSNHFNEERISSTDLKQIEVEMIDLNPQWKISVSLIENSVWELVLIFRKSFLTKSNSFCINCVQFTKKTAFFAKTVEP